MKLGCHAVLFRERIKSETEYILKGLSETGFQGVEIGSRFFGTEDKQYLTRLLKQYGIQLSGMHVGCPLIEWIEKEDECLRKVISVAEFVKDLPNKNIIMSGSPLEEGDAKAIACNIEKAAKKCLDLGVKLNYHNHYYEFENDAKMFKALVEYAPSLRFALDLGWVYKGGFDPIEILQKYASRIGYVHLRDAKSRDGREFVSLGEGIFNFINLKEVLNEVLGEEGWAIVEYEEGEQDFGRYARARKFLEELKY